VKLAQELVSSSVVASAAQAVDFFLQKADFMVEVVELLRGRGRGAAPPSGEGSGGKRAGQGERGGDERGRHFAADLATRTRL
jgi:hypothetical protein